MGTAVEGLVAGKALLVQLLLHGLFPQLPDGGGAKEPPHHGQRRGQHKADHGPRPAVGEELVAHEAQQGDEGDGQENGQKQVDIIDFLHGLLVHLQLSPSS